MARRKSVAWDSDRAHRDGQTSLEVLVGWLADSFNYARWKGGVVTKEDLCSEINSALRSERIHHRKNLDIRVKLMKLEKTFAVANQWLLDTGLYDSVMRGDCSADVKANLKKLCRYYDILAPGMMDTMMAADNELSSVPKGPHVVPVVSFPLKKKAVKKAVVANRAKTALKPVVETVPVKTTESEASDDEESSDSNEQEQQQRSDEETPSAVMDLPTATTNKPETVNESSDSSENDDSSSAGEEVDIPAAQEVPVNTSDNSSDDEEESEKEEENAQGVVVQAAEEGLRHEEAESEEESEEDKEPVKVAVKASPSGNANDKRLHAADAQAVKLVTPLMASQRIAITKAVPTLNQSDFETKESTKEASARAITSKDPVQATSLRHLRVLHRLDIEDHREKRKRQRTLYELELQKLQTELETKQMQRDQEQLNLEAARALTRQKLLSAGVSPQHVDRVVAK